MLISDLRTRLRAELGDETPGAYLWSDALLDDFIADAVQRFGEDVPLEREVVLSVQPDGSYVLPDDLLRVRSVFSEDEPLSGDEYAVWAGKLLPVEARVSDLTVQYEAARPRPSTDGDVTLGAGEDAALVWLSAGFAMEWLAKQREKAGAFPSANATSAVAEAYRSRYERLLTARRRNLQRVIIKAR